MVKKEDIRFGIRGKLLAATGFFIALLILILTLTNMISQTVIIKNRLHTKANALLSLLEKTSVDPILQLRIDLLRLYLKDVKQDPEVLKAYIYDGEGRLLTDGTEDNLMRDQTPENKFVQKAFTQSKVSTFENEDILDLVQPIFLSGRQVGSVRVVFSQEMTRAAVAGLRNRNLLFGVFFLLAGLIGAYFFSQIIAAPVLDLAEKADLIAKGDFEQRVFIKSNDELGVLGYSFNQMSFDLRKTTVAKKYVDDIIQHMADCLIVLDENHNIRTINRAAESLLGWSSEELLGKPMSFVLPEGKTLFAEGDIEHLLEKGSLLGVETEYKSRNGRHVPVSFSGAVMWNRFGKREGIVSVATDITEQKRMMEEILEAKKELERSNSDLEQFAYVASHDLQEPLRMVSSYMTLLRKRYKDKLDTSANEFIEYAVSGADRMRDLIQDLLMYSRLGTKKTLVPVSMKSVTDVALENLQVRIAETNAKVKVSEMPEILGDRVTLIQLIQNLTGNALKFQKPNQTPEVEITAVMKEKEWLFSVHDNGIGIEKEYLSKIFKIFERLHLNEEYEGTGIGLAVCNKIVENHNGRIWVESEPGNGTTFLFTAPILGA